MTPVIPAILAFLGATVASAGGGASSAAREFVVRYADGGECARMLEPALRSALFPRRVTFSSGGDRADMVVASIFGTEHLRWSRDHVPRVLVVGEPPGAADLDAAARDFDVVIVDFIPPAAAASAAPLPPLPLLYLYVPFWALSFGERRLNVPADLLAVQVRAKTRFCAFMYSHASPGRDAVFDAVSRYRRVDALGRAKASPTSAAAARAPDDRGVNDDAVTYNDLAVRRYRPYKFVIAGENSRAPGYVTEKIVSAMLAGAIPVYWGAPDVARHFNPRSFVDASRPGFVAEIERLDRDPVAYAAMLAQPRFAGNNRLPLWFSADAMGRALGRRLTKKKYRS